MLICNKLLTCAEYLGEDGYGKCPDFSRAIYYLRDVTLISGTTEKCLLKLNKNDVESCYNHIRYILESEFERLIKEYKIARV